MTAARATAIGRTAAFGIKATLGVLLFFTAVDTLRNIWTNWGWQNPFLSSAIVAAAAVSAWWLFGLVVWLGKPPQTASTLDADEWAPLADAQITEWADALRPLSIKEFSVLWSGEVNARKFYKTLKEAAGRAGIPEVNTGLGGTDYRGIEIVAAKDDPAGLAVLGLALRLTKYAKINTNPKDGARSGSIIILIGEKP